MIPCCQLEQVSSFIIQVILNNALIDYGYIIVKYLKLGFTFKLFIASSF